MKLLKPKWVGHEGKPIFSVDIHPDGSRFATGGQGSDSGRVVIWSMSPVRIPDDEINPDVPKVLCELTNHLACVNCVRWSLDGKWLASCGDDALVMIWQIRYQGTKSSSTFGGGSMTSEQWGLVHMLRGHNGDVLDLAWSKDLRYLASASVDNSIIVWNAAKFPEKHVVITGHSGLVKGITWDPVGKYIASQSDDKTVRFWRTTDWKEEKQISEPFKKCGGTTHVLRLSWSPDGKYVVSAHSLNNDGPTAHIIERTGWKTGMDFVGHRKAIEVVSFSPHLYRKESSDNHGCVAIGSRDRSLSVWLTNLKRPLVVLHDLFSDSILDISWGQDGYDLMVCSTDGTVAYFCFTEKELGRTLSGDSIDELYMSTYGTKRSSSSSSSAMGQTGQLLIEDPELLALQERAARASEGAAPTSSGGDGVPPTLASISMVTELSSSVSAIIGKQVESRTTDGRRRITPIRLSTESNAIPGPPLPFGFCPGGGVGVGTKGKGTVVPQATLLEKRTDKQEAPDKQEEKPVSVPSMSTPPAADKTETPPIGAMEATPSAAEKGPSDAALPSADTLPPPKPISFEALKGSGGSPSLAGKGQKRSAAEPASTPPPKAKRTKKLVAKVTTGSGSSKQGSTQPASVVHPTTHKQSAVSTPLPALLLPIPTVEQTVVVQISAGATPTTLQADNRSEPVCKLTCQRGEVVLWAVTLPSPVLVANGNQCMVGVACRDGSVSVFSSPTGRLLAARFMLPSHPHSLTTSGYHLMAVTCAACVYVWDMRSSKCVVQGTTFAHLLDEGATGLRSSWLCRNGLPILSMDKGAYTYHREMGVWVELWNPAEQTEASCSQFALTPSDSTPLDQVQRAGSGMPPPPQELLAALRNSAPHRSTLGYLEGQVSRSLCLSSPLEYQHWCRSYVRYMVREGLEARLREFCGEFVCPSGSAKVVLGLQKQAFLRDFLGLIGENAGLQRLYKELKDSLDSESVL